ncbi:linoelate diol synthase [Dacryopinax primogenitus]|uniref:Linoelate diol synthase n=1 Tax=Dacryopinax primogenitus (strain DJM 731) TaxID=1858805 RepID=M5GEA3_DACPD|nr:linoelate diol synthase [Dacryopinax primogenitus]EJU03113.1 linoelate diol synthase [Dacryopinax primogenitus]
MSLYRAATNPRESIQQIYYTTVDTVGSGASQAASLLEIDWLSRRPVPKSPDGLYSDQAAPESDAVNPKHSTALQLVEAVTERLRKGMPLTPDWSTYKALMDGLENNNWVGLNDREFLMEKVLICASKLPPGSRMAQQMNNFLVGLLYNDLPHPPSTFVGPRTAFRSADGSGNNLLIPSLGAAHTPYARSVTGQHPTTPSLLPDPGLIFDTLLRREERQDHPAGVSSMLFAFATIIIHSLFRTCPEPEKRHINDTSSYLDLSPLYGADQAAQDTVRNKDGRGKLYEDVFAENRLHILPPAVSALLIIFCRNHNFTCDKLLQINERGTWKDPAQLKDDAARRAQDDEIFNTARLINCGFLMNIILTDYLSAILGLVREGSQWVLDPLEFVRKADHSLLDRGTGNAVSVEFNLLYRWHSPISLEDEKWTEGLFRTIFADEPNIAWDEITIPQFMQKVAAISTSDQDPRDWTLEGQKRDPVTGRFSDELLAKLLQDATENSAQAFRARGTPAVMRVIEMLGIKEARRWGVCTLNEFRKFLGLKEYKKFTDWNSNKEVAHAAERLYGHIDNLELYPGLQAEEAKPVVDGAGLCPGYTISRGILADAVALTRGDRHFTTDFTPQALTAYGYQDCSRQTDNGSYGGTLGRLLFRHLPDYYHDGDIYGHFPMMVPKKMQEYLSVLDRSKPYNFDRPIKLPAIRAVNSYEGVKHVLRDHRTFKVTYGPNMKFLTEGYGFFLAFDDPAKHNRDRQMMQDALFSDANAYRVMGQYFYDKTCSFIREKSYSLSGHHLRCVDIVRDVINLAPVHWVSRYVSGLPIKTKEDPNAPFTEQSAYQIYMVIFTFIFLNIQPEYGWFLRTNAKTAAAALLQTIELHLNAISSSPISNPFKIIDSIMHTLWGEDMDVHAFFKRLIAAAGPDRPVKELAYNVLGVSVASAANFAHATVHVVNLYLEDKYKAARDDIVRIAELEHYGPQEEKLLEGYVREAMRLDPQAPGIFRNVASDASIKGEKDMRVHSGDRLWVSMKNAQMDPNVFKDPETVDPNRDPSLYLMFGGGSHAMHNCLGDQFTIKVMPYMLRAIFRLKGLKRGPGSSGVLNRFEQDLWGTKQFMYISSQGVQEGLPTPWPGTMVLQYHDH